MMETGALKKSKQNLHKYIDAGSEVLQGRFQYIDEMGCNQVSSNVFTITYYSVDQSLKLILTQIS